MDEKLYPGFIEEAFDRAINSYDASEVVNVSHDEARTTRTIGAYYDHRIDDVTYIGDGWEHDVNQWPRPQDCIIPRQDVKQGIYYLVSNYYCTVS